MNSKVIFLSCALICTLNVFSQSQISSDSLKKHVYILASDSLEGRGLATKSGMKAAKYIAGYFNEIGLKPVGDSYLHPFYARVAQTTLEGYNVVGMIEGTDPVLKNEYLVLGAHFDHVAFKIKNGEKIVYNGADDNASGTSAIIEIARYLIGQKEELKRSIVIVAFDGEESGLIGSSRFIENSTVPVDKVKLMMSIDMVGRYAESNSLIVGGMASLKGGDLILFELAGQHGINIKRTGKNISMRTDSRPFGDMGIPALHVSSGIIGPYHKPEDDAETIDYEGMQKISHLLGDLTIEISKQEDLIPINNLIANKKNDGLPVFRYGIKANIGSSYHEYPNEFYNGKSKFSSEIGLMAQLKLNNHFSLQPEVLYSTSGSDYSSGVYRTHSVTTPVRLVVATRMSRDMKQRLFFSFGGYYSYNFSGSVAGNSEGFNNTFSKEETGLVYGAGMEVMSVYIGVNFKHGLSNLSFNSTIGEIRNRATYFTIGYIF